jgi:phage baseplate assembly protein W
MTTSTAHTLKGQTVTVSVTLTETDPALTYLAGTIDWGDGTTTAIPRSLKVSNEYSSSYTHTYVNKGFYVIKVSGRNYKSPQPQTDLNIIYLDVGAAPIITVNRGFLRGPVLPDNSSVGDWVLNGGSDVQVIISDLRNLLLTQKGERLMNPDFGTQINKLVFEPDTSVLEAQVQQEVTQAIAKFEPRVNILSVSTERLPNDRQVNVAIQFQALNQFLTLGLNYS